MNDVPYEILGKDLKVLRLPRQPSLHKGSFGKLLVLAGSEKFPGAAQLLCLAALKAGAGYVYLDSDISTKIVSSLPEVIPQFIADSNAVVVGPGLDGLDLVEPKLELLKKDIPLIVDASALTQEFLVKISTLGFKMIVATPHPGEAARLLGLGVEEIQKDRTLAIKNLSKRYPNVHAWILKGSGTLVLIEDKIFINKTGSVAMATAGQGDVLSGILGALVLEIKPLKEALLASVFMHGCSADGLSKKLKTDRGVLPHEVAEHFPLALAQFRNESWPS